MIRSLSSINTTSLLMMLRHATGACKEDQDITPEARGSLINVSDFSNVVSGWLELTDEEYEHAKNHHGYDGPQEAAVRVEVDGTSWQESGQFLDQVRNKFAKI
jgi:hypothetical protein